MIMPSKEGHTLKKFDEELGKLRQLVLNMGGLVNNQIKRAIQALEDGDLEVAQEVIESDHVVNGLDVKFNEECTTLIVRLQPAGSDLRTVMSMSKTVTDLERIGDEAEKIARMAVLIYSRDRPPPNGGLLRDVEKMARVAITMFQDAMDALARLDVEKAVQVAQMDTELDDEYQASLRRLITYMMEDPRTIGHAIDILFVLKALERIGDHSKNITEYVIYMVKGKDVRHISPETIAKDLVKNP